MLLIVIFSEDLTSVVIFLGKITVYVIGDYYICEDPWIRWLLVSITDKVRI